MDSLTDYPLAASSPLDWETLLHWYDLEGRQELAELQTSQPIEDSGYLVDQEVGRIPADGQLSIEPHVENAVVSLDADKATLGQRSGEPPVKNGAPEVDTAGSSCKDNAVNSAEALQQ